MNTDEMILALVERHGFVLPEGLSPGFVKDGGPDWWLTMLGRSYPASPKHANDLCACEFARGVKARGETHSFPSMGLGETFRQAMYYGDSAAAIHALYEALEAQQPEGK